MWNTKEISMDEIYLACVLLLEEMSCEESVQKNGIVMIHDYEGFAFSHFRKLTMRNFIRILQIMQVSNICIPSVRFLRLISKLTFCIFIGKFSTQVQSFLRNQPAIVILYSLQYFLPIGFVQIKEKGKRL